MSEDSNTEPSVEQPVTLPQTGTTIQARTRLLILITVSILVSFGLVVLAVAFYRLDGTIQRDITLPIYAKEREKLEAEDTRTFSETGDIDAKAMADYRILYDDHLNKIVDVDGFSSKALSDDAIGLGPVFED